MNHLLISVTLSICMLLKWFDVADGFIHVNLNSPSTCRSRYSLKSMRTIYLVKPETDVWTSDLDCTVTFDSRNSRPVCVTMKDHTSEYECPYTLTVYSYKPTSAKMFKCGTYNPKPFHYCSTGTRLTIKLDRPSRSTSTNRHYDFSLYVAENTNPEYGSTTTTTMKPWSSWSSWDNSGVNTVSDQVRSAVISVGAIIGIVVGGLLLLTCIVIICCCCRKSRGFSGSTYQQQPRPTAQPLVMHQTGTQPLPSAGYPQSSAMYTQPTGYPQPTGGYPQPTGYPQPYHDQPSGPYGPPPNAQNAAEPPPSYEDAIKPSAPEPTAPPLYEKPSKSYPSG